MPDLSFYFHWPFCVSKCPYCDFNVHVQGSIDHAQWQAAYVGAIRSYAKLYKGRQVKSIYFGGGTPSLMPPEMVAAILDEISAHWSVDGDAEITLEANPTTVEIDKFKAFKSSGINRLSLGVQSLYEDQLRFLGRAHDRQQALDAIETARIVFDRFSFDLIYARPDQTLKQWEEELAEAAKLAQGHLSLYQLTVERNTPFYLAHSRGEFFLPEEGLAADFYHLTQDVLSAHGLPAYEVSNHAAAGQESQHNLVYWNYGDYIGIGPGAHGRITSDNGARYATRDHYAPQKWLEWVQTKGTGAHEHDILSPWEQGAESLMMGLRLFSGVDLTRNCAQGMALGDFLDHGALDNLASEGWICYEGSSLRLTTEGMLRLNAILPYLVSDQTTEESAL